MKSLKFAFIQSGYCVFGAGYTRKQAISDARKWLESPEGVQGGMTFRAVENLLSNQRIDGGFRIISSSDDEFNSYMGNQDGFIKRGNGWYPQK